MIKRWILLSLGLLPFVLQAQVTINAQLPQAGLIQKDQLWNLIIVNNSGSMLDANIQMIVQDISTGQVVMTASTGNVVLNKGLKLITSKDAQPIIYNYTMPEYTKSYLPFGAYSVCYRVYGNGEQRDELLGDDCIAINIDPLSPPLLNTPADKSIVETPYPQFSWMPPAPFDMFSNLNYDLVVTEVVEGQSATEAIQYNVPLYSKNNIIQTTENYQSSFTALVPGKTYAWQVVAKNSGNYAAKTEVWTFKLGKQHVNTVIVNDNNDTYFLLNNDITGTYSIQKGNLLRIKYFSFDKTHTESIVFYDKNGVVITTIHKLITQGDNFLDLELNNHYKSGETYKLSMNDLLNKSYALTFSIKK
ncbi:MAG: hypothetical protein HY305_03020 [Sphingobacteriales bacterium]|nr:hypothetical protein [Sphingobacteriales bacterium]